MTTLFKAKKVNRSDVSQVLTVLALFVSPVCSQVSHIKMAKSYETAAFFEDVPNKEIDAIEGQTIVIPCTVRNLGAEKVSWIRSKDIQILTTSHYTFSSDYRFEVVHSDKNEDFWGLRIRGIKPSDTGQYECQVNTEPKMSLAYNLIVSSLGPDDQSKWLGYASIKAANETFIRHGSPFFISCEISHRLRKHLNLDVWWLHEDTQIFVQLKESRISIQTTYNKDRNIINSILSFQYITWQDGGTYTCLQPSIRKDSIKLIIVEGESSEAMQKDCPVSSTSSCHFVPYVTHFIMFFIIFT
ncbi:uncharacterized protein LOC126734286 isoform X2 [Anthonomus grandis grandis]|uniref:uncharacterized protein LOC126734286 isoform X2 n=1 Tax=Anthonomus grandis grandis TaxID=2921223 RepID=UPI0021650B66|nr:uncharacterized protein LOC126734286 isoform X2 [Anthonomus grandis grandis]